MPVQKTCEHCQKTYFVVPARANKTRFCGVACRNVNDRTAERKEIECQACGDTFTAVKDHGRWPKFCCVECLRRDAVKPQEKQCASCGCVFLATRTSHETQDGLRKYCSKACHIEGLKNGAEFQCLNCDAPFYLSPSAIAQRGGAGCCSNECRSAFYQGVNSAGFKGGFYKHSQAGEKHVLLQRPGYVAKYIGEHRLVASQVIGRMVTRCEYVIRINRTPDDNRPENLFICESNSEFSQRRNGSLPWPDRSNLQDYKTSAV